MPYEFSVFTQMVRGDLSPVYFPLDSSPNNLQAWYSHLRQPPATATQHIHAHFSLEDHTLLTDTLQVRLIDHHRPPVFVAENHTVYAYQQVSGETLLSQILVHLSLDKEAVIEWYHWQDEQTQLHLEFYARYPLETLSLEERRYHYYQWLLGEQVNLVQQRMVAYVHKTTSEKKASKYVQEHQRALLILSSQVLQHLDEGHPHIYTLSDQYTLPDIYKLIFISLESLTTFLQQQFAVYLDTTAPVAYRDRVIHAFRMRQQLETIQPALEQSGINPSLQAVLSKPFQRIQALPQQEVTHLSLGYLQKLLQGLENLIQADTVNQEHLIALLFVLNFNSSAFIDWFTQHLEEELAILETKEERLKQLYYHHKYCKQLSVERTHAYQLRKAAVDEQLLTWINEEIAYLEKTTTLSEPIQQDATAPRIRTTLSVPQIALLLRAFMEVGVFSDKHKANTFRHFSRILQAQHQEDISAKSLQDKSYQPDRHTVAALKEKVIAVFNFLNSL